MDTWSVHYLNARGALDPFKDRIDAALREVSRRVVPVTDPVVLDIVIQAIPNGGIPDIGHAGKCACPGNISFTFDPGNPNLDSHMGEPLERMIAHELHHALRWDSVGYDRTLGAALVMEGLAGRFVQELYGNDGELWEQELPREDLNFYAENALPLIDSTEYDHGKWFYGKKPYPRWVGYALGWHVVGDYLQAHPDAKSSSSIATPSDAFFPYLDALVSK